MVSNWKKSSKILQKSVPVLPEEGLQPPLNGLSILKRDIVSLKRERKSTDNEYMGNKLCFGDVRKRILCTQD